MAEHYDQHLDYVRTNPHADELRKLFGAANIEYGRIDYTIADGRIQVFEINTNPAGAWDPATKTGRHVRSGSICTRSHRCVVRLAERDGPEQK